jgi:hypothetical protein
VAAKPFYQGILKRIRLRAEKGKEVKIKTGDYGGGLVVSTSETHRVHGFEGSHPHTLVRGGVQPSISVQGFRANDAQLGAPLSFG